MSKVLHLLTQSFAHCQLCLSTHAAFALLSSARRNCAAQNNHGYGWAQTRPGFNVTTDADASTLEENSKLLNAYARTFLIWLLTSCFISRGDIKGETLGN